MVIKDLTVSSSGPTSDRISFLTSLGLSFLSCYTWLDDLVLACLYHCSWYWPWASHPTLFRFLELAKPVLDFKLLRLVFLPSGIFYPHIFTYLASFCLRGSHSNIKDLKEAFQSTGSKVATITPTPYHHSVLTPPPTPSYLYHRGQQTFSVKGQIMNIWDFAGQAASVTTTHLGLCGMKAATGNT